MTNERAMKIVRSFEIDDRIGDVGVDACQTLVARITQLETALNGALDAIWRQAVDCSDCPVTEDCDAEEETCKRLWRERLMGKETA